VGDAFILKKILQNEGADMYRDARGFLKLKIKK
jgi:hypothetical protein